MVSHYKKKDLLKIHPFYSGEITNNKKKTKRKLEKYLDYHHLLKNYLILNYQKYSHFYQKNLKDLKD